MFNHNLFRKLNNAFTGFSIISIIGLLITFIGNFYSLKQGTTFIGAIVDANFYSSIAFFIMLGISLVWISCRLFLLYLGKIEPDVKIRDFVIGNEAYIRIRNEETVAIENVSVNMISFKINDWTETINAFDISKTFSVGLLEIGRKIIPNSDFIKVLIAQGIGLKYTEFFTDEQSKHIQDLHSDKNQSWNKYEMVFEIYGQLADEKVNRLLGRYKGLLVHINHFQQKENEIISDNLVWENFENTGRKSKKKTLMRKSNTLT